MSFSTAIHAADCRAAAVFGPLPAAAFWPHAALAIFDSKISNPDKP
jgi:hypothetical protein